MCVYFRDACIHFINNAARVLLSAGPLLRSDCLINTLVCINILCSQTHWHTCTHTYTLAFVRNDFFIDLFLSILLDVLFCSERDQLTSPWPRPPLLTTRGYLHFTASVFRCSSMQTLTRFINIYSIWPESNRKIMWPCQLTAVVLACLQLSPLHPAVPVILPIRFLFLTFWTQLYLLVHVMFCLFCNWYIYAHITGFLCNYARQITFSACICKQSRCCVSMKINLATGWTLNLANTLYTMQNKLFAKIKMSTLQLRIRGLGGGGERDRFLPLVPTSTDSTL